VTDRRFVLGVDLGQANDFTALVVLERVDDELHARHIERLRLGTSYPRQVERIVALVDSPELAHDVLVAVDGTGVGRAVVDLLRDALKPLGTPLVAVTITAGSTATRVGSRWSVPKRDLVAAAQVALQTKTLKIASQLPTAQLLVDELTAYRVKVSEDGRDSYSNGRDQPNDDLVLAASLAVYAATKRTGRRMVHGGKAAPIEAPRVEADIIVTDWHP
jgi:phage FluMu gp28-like protein